MIWIPAFAGMTNTINHPHPPPTGRQAALSPAFAEAASHRQASREREKPVDEG